MIIALDGHMIGTRETGNETYALELAFALGALDSSGEYLYALYTADPAVGSRIEAARGLSVRPLPEAPSWVRIPWIYPRLAQRDHVGLLHVQYVAPPVAPCPVVVTVHDVSHRIYPQFFSPKARLIVHPLTGLSMKRATHIIASSECTRRDLDRFYRIPPSRVTVVPLAAGLQYRPQPPDEVERLRRRYELPASYVLSVGNLQPRKNLARLIEAFGAVAAGAPGTRLVIAGNPTRHASELEQAVRHLGLEDRVSFIGYVQESDLPALYSGAAVFCYPSLYEGFGLPPLEAMACGAPTIVSNASSLPEVGGDAALAVDPTSTVALVQALRLLLNDPALRAWYRQKGLARAASFSWRRTAELTRDVYDRVLSKSTRAKSGKHAA